MNQKIQSMEHYAKKYHVPIMKHDGIEWLLEMVRQRHPKMILELGTAIGYSAIRMASLYPDILIDTLEIDVKRANIARQNIEDQHLSNRIIVHCGDIFDFIAFKEYDFIFIDAAKSQYLRYMEHFRGNLSEKGVFVFDNLNFHGLVDDPEQVNSRSTRQMLGKIKQFRQLILTDPQFESEYYAEIGDGVALVRYARKV